MSCYLCGAVADSDLCPQCAHLTDPIEIAMKQRIADYFRKQVRK